MPPLTIEDLRQTTLSRQFPAVTGGGAAAVLELLDRIGPIQSQVPRAPFLAIAARLPGTSYATICELFESHQLVKTSNLRGTVHASTRRQFPGLDAVSTQRRHAALSNVLRLAAATPEDINAEVRRFCDGHWRARTEIVRQLRDWLAAHESAASSQRLAGTMAESLIWGNSGLIRRPKDGAWERRTDIYHRTAITLVADLAAVGPQDALVELIRHHVAAYGPMTRKDLSFFFGVGLGQVDTAVSRLGDELVRVLGPLGEMYVDLAEPPNGGDADPGLRLLPEFDGLLLGFHGSHRTRFLDEAALTQVWAKVNGVFNPVVLHDGRLVATWRMVTAGKRTALEVRMLAAGPPLTGDLFDGPVAVLEDVVPVSVDDVRIFPPNEGR